MKKTFSYLIIVLISGVIMTGAGLTLKKGWDDKSNIAYLREVYNLRIVNAFPEQPEVSEDKPVMATRCSQAEIMAKLKGQNSIINYLRSQNRDYSFAGRKKLAAEYLVSDYNGSAKGNLELLAKLKGVYICN